MIFKKELKEHFHNMENSGPIIDALYELGVVDTQLVKILCVRKFINEKISKGMKKVDAMWAASGKFHFSYEYARKCLYYYTDVNFPE